MLEAGRRLFSPELSFEGIPVAGRLDPLIMADLLRAIGVEPTSERLKAYREVYGEVLAEKLAHPATPIRAMPGVHELIAALAGEPERAALGLLTGNFAETGRLKLRACAIDPGQFPIGVWGDDSPSMPPTRNDLPGVGMERYRERTGRTLRGGDVVVIGDTPHDVACAQAHGCRSLAVGTGKFSIEELRAAGATRAVETLGETASILGWLLRP